jgi:hypothetical protein
MQQENPSSQPLQQLLRSRCPLVPNQTVYSYLLDEKAILMQSSPLMSVPRDHL